MSALYGRACSLIVSDQSGNGLDLSQLRIVFSVNHGCLTTPKVMAARVYNLADATVKSLFSQFSSPGSTSSSGSGAAPGTPSSAGAASDPTVGEAYQSGLNVLLSAGYVGNVGLLFQGNVKQLRRGRESAVDTFVDIFAADGDVGMVSGVANQTLPSGYTQTDVFNGYAAALQPYGINSVAPAGYPTQQAPRGRVLYGSVQRGLRVLGKTTAADHVIHDGTLTSIPQNQTLSTQAVVLTSRTGLIGWPTQTADGITMRSLLNANLRSGTRVQIDNASVSGQSGVFSAAENLGFTATNFFPSTNDDGLYKVFWVDHSGDTRGNPWYSDLVCLSVAPDSRLPIGSSVLGVVIPA